MTEHHQRINERLNEYWNELKGSRAFPSEQDIDPDAIADIWDSCFLIQIRDHHDGTLAFQYSYLGTKLIEAYGDDLTGQDVYENLIATYTNTTIEHVKRVLETHKPIEIESEFTNHHNMEIRYRQCLLPLGPDEHKIDYILGGMRWRSF